MSSYPTLWNAATQYLTRLLQHKCLRGQDFRQAPAGGVAVRSTAQPLTPALVSASSKPDTPTRLASSNAAALPLLWPILSRCCASFAPRHPAGVCHCIYSLNRFKNNNEEVKGFGCHSFWYHSTSLGTDTKEKHTYLV